MPLKEQLAIPKDLIESIISKDVDEVDGTKKTKIKLGNSYAVMQEIYLHYNHKTIYKDQENEGISIDYKTYETYTNALQRLYIIENIKAWSPAIRSASTIRTSDKKQFVDPSIAVLLSVYQ